MKRVGKKILASIISQRLFNAIPPKVIYSAIEIICNNVSYDLVENSIVSVENFGTLSPYVFHGHKASDVCSEGFVEIQPFRSVKLNPHRQFELMIQKKKSDFS